MSKAILDEEAARFLDIAGPQVLCIKGKWGVGKTFAWKKIVSDRAAGDPKMPSYAYVSLFGINSLAALKFSIFEQTMSRSAIGEGPSTITLQAQLDKLKGLGRKLSGYAGGALGLYAGTDASEMLSQSTFFLVRDQIACIDDLERKGRDLDLRDVLGLASFLKEERNCKVVLLLNDEQLEGADQNDFKRNLEKVVDTTVPFEPTAAEACAIAFEKPDSLQIELVQVTTTLGITNIRVLVKIERQARRAWELVEAFGTDVQKQSTTAVVLAGWSVMEPDEAPSLEFLRKFNSIGILMRDRNEAPSAEEIKWSSVLRNLNFAKADEFDRLMFDSVEMGRFDADAVRAQAAETMKLYVVENEKTSFEHAWDRYHDRLDNDDDTIAEELAATAIDNIATVSPGNINSTVNFLEQFGYSDQAKSIVEAFFVQHKDDARLLDRTGVFLGERINPLIGAGLARMRKEYVDPRDPKDVLAAAAEKSGWSQNDVRLLSQQDADYFERLFLEARGAEAHRMIDIAISMSSNSREGEPLRRSLEEALTTISKRSPMMEAKLKRYLAQLDTN